MIDASKKIAWLVLLAGIAVLAAYVVFRPWRLPSVARQELSLPNPLPVAAVNKAPAPKKMGETKEDPMAGWNTSTRQAFALLPENPKAEVVALELDPERHVFQVGTETENGATETYVWLVSDGLAQLIATGTTDECSGYNISKTPDGFRISRMDSPCEATMSVNDTYYSPAGVELGSSGMGTPGSVFSYTWGKRDYHVELVFRGKDCGDELTADERSLPSVELLGVKVNGKLYALPKPKVLSCETGYSETINNPSLESLDYLGGGRIATSVSGISFTLDPKGSKLVSF